MNRRHPAADRSGRRRFLKIAAAAVGSAVLPTRPATSAGMRHVQRDFLLGADTEIQLYHPDAQAARAAIARCFVEVRRLENIFSLEQPASILCQLNRNGRLEHPPAELVALLERAHDFGRATSGAFDVTVQPLWELFVRHFAANRADVDGPTAADQVVDI